MAILVVADHDNKTLNSATLSTVFSGKDYWRGGSSISCRCQLQCLGGSCGRG